MIMTHISDVLGAQGRVKSRRRILDGYSTNLGKQKGNLFKLCGVIRYAKISIHG
jgi:hypothetical protein